MKTLVCVCVLMRYILMGRTNTRQWIKCLAQGHNSDWWVSIPVLTLYRATVLHGRVASCIMKFRSDLSEPQHEISNNVVCATSKASDQPVHMQSDQRFW